MAVPCKTNKSSIRLEIAPLLKFRSIEGFEPKLVLRHFSLLQVLALRRKFDRKPHVVKDAVGGWFWLVWWGGVVRGGLYLFKASL